MTEINRSGLYTAEDLFQLLKDIPVGVRERLPIIMAADDINFYYEGPVDVDVFEVTETEGCIERGFRLVKPEEE